MRALLREARRAPVRIATSVLALALAVGAIGVLAIPTVASGSLRSTVERDRMASVVLATTDTGTVDPDAVLGALDGIIAADPRVSTSIGLTVGADALSVLPVVGVDPDDQTVDVLTLVEGRLPRASASGSIELVVAPGVADVGARLPAATPTGERVEVVVVGVGTSSYWSGSEVAFTTTAGARDLADLDGSNRIALRTAATDAESLATVVDAARRELAEEGVAFTSMPVTLPDGTHPIEEDIAQVSTMIGFLGVVAGLVALVLLATTVTTLITERSREVAVMRALGATGRTVRRRLRRIAMAIAFGAVLVGVPLGIVVANLIARLVLQEFVGLTPAVGVSVPVALGSVLFALIGARVVASGAARRVARTPLATALRDRDGNPFGRRPMERWVARSGIGALFGRVAVRNLVHRRARAVAICSEVAAAVAALLIVASMATTINAFNAAESEPWNWSSRTTVAGDGLDIDPATLAADPLSEPGIEATGKVAGWQVDVVGVGADTVMIDRSVDAGRWLDGPGEAVLSTGFADRAGLGVGDDVDVSLANGVEAFRVVGLHPLRGRAVFVADGELAAMLGQPGRANVVWSARAEPGIDLGPLVTTTQMAERTADESARNAILVVFGALGAVLVTVAGLAVASGVAVEVFERRRELAAVRAIGGRSRHLVRIVATQLLPLVAAGTFLGVLAGYLGARSVVESFERADAVEIGLVFASGAIPAVALVVVAGGLTIAGSMVRRIGRTSIAQTLRSTT